MESRKSTNSLRILGDQKRSGMFSLSKKEPSVELKRVTREKTSKTLKKPDVVGAENMCATATGKTVSLPENGGGKEAKKRRAFEDLGNFGNKSKQVDHKRLKKLERLDKFSVPVPGISKGQPNVTKVKTYSSADTKVKIEKSRSLKKQKALSRIATLSVPTPVASQDSNWDLTNLSRAIDHVLCEPPEGVVDIDEVCNDYFYCPQYAQDIMIYLKEKEIKYKISPDFLDDDPEVNPNMRSILIDWLVQVQTHLNLKQKTLHSTVALIDMYLSRKRVPLSKLQLIGITTLLVASKFEERFAPTIDKLVHLTDNTYSYNNVIHMELVVLKGLKFFVNPPVAIEFLDRYLMCLPIEDELENLSRYILDLCLHDYNSLEFAPSLKSATSIYLSCKVLPSLQQDMKQPWTDDLQFYTGYKESDLHQCAERFARMLLKAPASKYQGAREKFGHSTFKAISNYTCLCSPIVRDIAKGIHTSNTSPKDWTTTL